LRNLLGENADVLSYGSDRAAYLYNNRVIKLPIGETAGLQSTFEKDIWETMPDEFRQFFPNPEFIGRTIIMDYVKIAESVPHNLGSTQLEIDDDDEDQWYSLEDAYDTLMENMHDIFLTNEVNDIVAYALLENLDVDWGVFAEFALWFKDRGGLLIDIFQNASNFGQRNGKLQIVDWGWSYTSKKGRMGIFSFPCSVNEDEGSYYSEDLETQFINLLKS
jgi:hypothetical protein